MKSQNLVTKPLPSAVTFALVQQLIVIVLAAMILDGGVTVRAALCALVVFWGGVSMLAIRRRGAKFTKVDSLLIRWTYIPLCIAAFFLTGWI